MWRNIEALIPYARNASTRVPLGKGSAGMPSFSSIAAIRCSVASLTAGSASAGSREDPLRRLSVRDAAQRSFAFAVCDTRAAGQAGPQKRDLSPWPMTWRGGGYRGAVCCLPDRSRQDNPTPTAITRMARSTSGSLHVSISLLRKPPNSHATPRRSDRDHERPDRTRGDPSRRRLRRRHRNRDRRAACGARTLLNGPMLAGVRVPAL
jgi:hypothetical protein